ncbi:MAG: ABC transporter permease [Candidatus Omnitrophica bacterium]|nr:ABC transporter permease [Candidatus Omnitrophota bacterium]MBU1923856.1 ABC transporter permease [Candidatus Omnitrophota bacterium]
MTYLLLSILLLCLHFLFFACFVDAGTCAVILAANLLFTFNGIKVYRKMSLNKFSLYLFGYLLLFIFVFILSKANLLFAIFVILYSSIFNITYLLPYLIILIFSVIFVTPYWMQVFILFGAFYFFVNSIYKKTYSRFFVAMFSIGFIFLLLIFFPILYIFLQVTPQSLLSTFKNNEFQQALFNSLITSGISTVVILIFGVPLAYCFARKDFAGKRFLDNLINLPILIPQTVVGIALLVVLGPKSPVGEFMFKNCRLAVANGYLGIIAAQIFVSSPFLIRSAINAFEGIDQRLEDASRTLGASELSTFMRISLPLAGGGIFSGCILALARALSEVGSLMVIAYHPMTAPVYIYDQFIQYGLSEIQPMAVLLVISCLWAFIGLHWLRHQMIKKVK